MEKKKRISVTIENGRKIMGIFKNEVKRDEFAKRKIIVNRKTLYCE